MSDYDKFHAAAVYWQRALGLNYDIQIVEIAGGNGKTICDTVTYPLLSKAVVVFYTSTYNSAPLVHQRPNELALHEMLHILYNSIEHNYIALVDNLMKELPEGTRSAVVEQRERTNEQLVQRLAKVVLNAV